jgi:hypothetical protein
MNISDLCTSFVTSKNLKDETERNVVEFAEAPWGLGMGTVEGVPALYPVQKFILKCFYNIPLLDDVENRTIIIKDRFNEQERFRFTEIEYLHFLVEEGRANIREVTGEKIDTRQNLNLIIGRRGTKTSTIAVIVAFETYKLIKKFCPQNFYNIMPDDEIRVSCIATNQEQAAELFHRITGHLERAEYFKKYRNKPTLNYMQISTPRDIEQYGDGQRPSIRIVASPCSGRGLRGHNNIVAVLDEMAYFFETETSADKSDRAVYDAITPSVAKFNAPDGEPHGRVICISSPATRAGKFYELYNRSMEHDCKDLLMIKAPTWEVDYTLSPKFLRAKYAENPLTYMSEYGAEFSDRISAWIENEQVLRVNIIPNLRLKKMSYERIPHFMGIDVGLKGDGTALAICHIVKKESEGILKDFIELDQIAVRYAVDEDKEYFHPEDMAEWIASFAEKFFIVKGMLDQYYGLSMLPILHDKKGLKQITVTHMGRDMNSKIYQNLMSKMLDASLRIPETEEVGVAEGKVPKDLPLITEMLKLKATVHSKYMISVAAPDIKGMHDDLSDAFARAVYLATEYMAQGGGVKRPIADLTGSGVSYKRFQMKQKKGAMYTNRPSSGMQMEMARGGRNALDRIGTSIGGRWR